jgi:hypothetical protein
MVKITIKKEIVHNIASRIPSTVPNHITMPFRVVREEPAPVGAEFQSDAQPEYREQDYTQYASREVEPSQKRWNRYESIFCTFSTHLPITYNNS